VIPVASDEFLELVAAKFRMLADPTRLAILHCLMQKGEMNVSQIVAASGRSTANVSKHLKQLSEARMVGRRKDGSYVLYRLNDPVLKKICEMTCDSLRRELESEVRRKKQLLQRRT
jgi:ArsR family transcriptional regulator